MSVTTTPGKVGLTCSACGFERWWPRGFFKDVKSCDDMRVKARRDWGWTFDGGDYCDDCSRLRGFSGAEHS